jgi:hypothetical protein
MTFKSILTVNCIVLGSLSGKNMYCILLTDRCNLIYVKCIRIDSRWILNNNYVCFGRLIGKNGNCIFLTE